MLVKTYSTFNHWAHTEPYPIVCNSSSSDGIFMKEYSWTIKIPLKNRDFTSVFLIKNSDFIILNDSVISSSGDIQYFVGEDQGGNSKGFFVTLDNENLPSELILNLKVRASEKLEKNKCQNFQILFQS